MDWFVQSKIKDSLRNVEGALSRIKRILIDLRSNHDLLNNQLKEREEDVRSILEE